APWLTVTDETCRRLMLSSTRPTIDVLMRVTWRSVTTMTVGKTTLPRVSLLVWKRCSIASPPLDRGIVLARPVGPPAQETVRLAQSKPLVYDHGPKARPT